jgi:signal transduction histidine kinase
MSYRSFTRILGETSLELKCLFLFGVFLLLVITVSFLLYWRVTGELINRQNPNTGRLLVDQAMLIKHWEELETSEQFLPVLQDLTAKLSKQEYQWRFIRRPNSRIQDPKGEGQPRDKFEVELLERFLKYRPGETDDPKNYAWDERSVAGGDEYQYYQAVRAQRSCLSFCHSSMPGGPGFDLSGSGIAVSGGDERLAEGDLMAVLQVTIPNGPTRATVNWFWNTLLAVAIITAFLAMIAFYITIHYVIVRPLAHLRYVSDAISHGNINLRAEIYTGDEFEALAIAFNRMLRHLVTIQDELRQVNASLDSKVDELAQVNMQLYEMNRIKSDFLATMSHELRTPLNSILGFSDVLGSIASLDDKQKRYVQNIQKSGRMLLDMINNILDLAKIESGKMDIRLTDFSIAQVIHAQCDMARPLTEKKNIDLEAEIQPDLPPLYQDQSRVQQVLNNLLSNAIKFTPEGGRIKVTAERNSRGELLLRVIDTGVGIAEEDQQVIFEKFRQGRTAMPGGDAMTREYSGTGLGLSIVKELCKLLDGEVLVESELGKGSTFTVRLPWRIQKQPRLDSPLVAGFEEFGKPKVELPRSVGAEPVPTADAAVADGPR